MHLAIFPQSRVFMYAGDFGYMPIAILQCACWVDFRAFCICVVFVYKCLCVSVECTFIRCLVELCSVSFVLTCVMDVIEVGYCNVTFKSHQKQYSYFKNVVM